MCFFLYSPSKKIEIDYLSESMFLSPFGSSIVTADLLVFNPSKDEKIEKLTLSRSYVIL